MSSAAASVVAPNHPWLSQGDIFESALIVRAGVAQLIASQAIARGPALLISHDCAIDKKSKSASRLEYLSFLPIQDVSELPSEPAGLLRAQANELQPYEALYLGAIPPLGEGYAMLTQPYTLPSLLLRTELQAFTAHETGDVSDTRIVPTIGDTRIGQLTEPALELFRRKWAIQWTRRDIVIDE